MRLLGIPASLSAPERRILLLLGAAFFIGQYDMTLLTLALPDVQESFSIAEEELGTMIAIARLGALPAIALALLSDGRGRRRLLVVSLVGLSIFSLATSFAQTANQFIFFQANARLFTTLEEILAVVYALELLPSRHRGWGVGFLAAMGGLGSGLASLLYGLSDYLPGGWRALYVIGGLAIMYVAWLRRSLPESPMFEQQQPGQVKPVFWQPLLELFRHHRLALLALTLIAGMFWFQAVANLNFMSKYLQDSHGYSPSQVSIMFVVAGTFAIFGNVIAGRTSDRVGRRPVLAFGIALNCATFLLFYNTSGWMVPLAWIAALFSFFVVDVMVNAIAGELFPTHCRSTAATLRAIISLVAAAAGLAIEGSLYTALGSHGAALSLMTLSSLLALPAVLFWLRETANIELQ
ncbi:MFS transporter [Halieaceae bacterium IMCC14734]|uniref:MFS transporter n=1 Tax=Candidatus Litorirhabdus singularis TaxID=2518993 RepID=A0ABT3TJX3_9GAMM|nr:MFS transporter [Candidatus Litorirhabdus singularis]MCX2982612.1 MFS transporter [Candidatus Litorirhabdus singularis]